MNKLFATILVASIALLSGCNGSSGENTTDSGPNPTPTSIVLAIQNASGEAQQSFEADEDVTVVATLYDENNAIIAGRTITFDSTLGALSASTKLTNSAGQAIVSVTNDNLAAGAGTVTASLDSLSDAQDFEFITEPAEQSFNISAELLLGGLATSQFKADEQVQIRATLTNADSQPIEGEIVTFTADVGELVTTTALSKSDGTASVTLSGNDQLGAGVITVSIDDNEVSPARVNYEVIAADAVIVDEGVRIGYVDDNDNFVEGEIALGTDSISAGGTVGLSVALVDGNGDLVTTPTAVSFTSNCAQSGDANLDDSVFSIKGSANATFEDISCAGSSGIDDVIIASITVNGITSTASAVISIAGESLGSIEFISAEPTSIVLKGTGGQGKQETSTLTFVVKSALDNPLAQQQVDFVLDTSVGGISLNPMSGLTNSQGVITTKVTAGTVPTAVRVTAKSAMTVDSETIEVQTQSDLLSVNTGLPEQRSLTISTSIQNPEANSINGVEATITAQLADNFNNPVPDGTTVNFTTEGGMIQPSCTTTNGACSVTWTSAEPRVPDHRITVLATALGHETFFDTNGNNTFDDADGDAIVSDAVSSGFGRSTVQASGFVDMSEAYRDDNENQQYDNGETFLDFNNDNAFSTQDGLFNGPQCQGDSCASEGNQAIHVRKSLVMDMASSSALFSLTNSQNGDVYENNDTGVSATIPDIADGSSINFNLYIADTANQAMPRGTQVSISSTVGDLQGITSFTVPDTLSPSTISFVIINPLEGDPETGVLEITITSPSGIITSAIKSIDLL